MIAGSNPMGLVFWQITGIRNDTCAQNNRVQVEVDKENSNQGKYMHAEAWAKKLEVNQLPQIEASNLSK